MDASMIIFPRGAGRTFAYKPPFNNICKDFLTVACIYEYTVKEMGESLK
jgi:hypothetical protein